MSRRHILLPVVAALAAVSLAACGSSTDASTDETSGGGSASSGESSGESGGSGSFSIAIGEPDSLVPGNHYVAYEVVTSLWSPLVFIDESSPDGWVPLAAKSVTSEDSTTWTIELNEGWTFHDGTPVTAQSYVDAWNYVANKTNAQVNSGQLAQVVGYADLNPAEGDPATDTMSGLAVVDDTTFTVTLAGADSTFPLQLSSGQTALYPLPASFYDDPAAFNTHPIGQGAYAMAGDWEADSTITLTAYADYAGEPAKTATVELVPYLDTNTAYTDVLAGNLDIVFVPASRFSQVATDFAPEKVVTNPSPGISTLGFPLSDPRYADPRVREAISMSIDREAISQAIFGGFNTPATALTPAAMVGSPTDLCDACVFDPEAAKALLAEAGGWDGQMIVQFPGGIGGEELYEAIANQIRQNLEIDDVVAQPTTDWAEWSTVVEAGTFAGPHFARWGALYPSMQDTLRNMYTATGGCFLCTQYSDPEVDALLDQAAAAPSVEEANVLFVQAQERILEDFPTAPLFNDAYTYALSDHVASAEAVSGSIVLSSVSVED